MKLIKKLEPNFNFEDGRGTLTELVNNGEYKQVNAVFTKKDAIRGGFHYHRTTKEAFYIISGAIEVTASLDSETEIATFHTGDFFMIDEFVRHNMNYLEDTYLVVLYTSKVEQADGTKDIIAD
ncbi:MAG: cupin domain-containing protein [Clostridia bacterium]|nr:cupin domain-containing protein [Clostridia bacterium]